ncbi:DUF3649 domain-containing protein [Massilia forsythiae]|nr:DUF3649 domain-containing protein [Massilia forsythiae]
MNAVDMSDHPAAPRPAPKQRRAGITLRQRGAVAARALAAILGGYGVAALSTNALAAVLPLRPVEAVVSATLTGLAVYPCAAMWAFAARSATRAWVGLALFAVVPGLVLLARSGGQS